MKVYILKVTIRPLRNRYFKSTVNLLKYNWSNITVQINFSVSTLFGYSLRVIFNYIRYINFPQIISSIRLNLCLMPFLYKKWFRQTHEILITYKKNVCQISKHLMSFHLLNTKNICRGLTFIYSNVYTNFLISFKIKGYPFFL